jgi:hypothetical protein
MRCVSHLPRPSVTDIGFLTKPVAVDATPVLASTSKVDTVMKLKPMAKAGSSVLTSAEALRKDPLKNYRLAAEQMGE